MKVTPGLEGEAGVNAVVKAMVMWLPVTVAPASAWIAVRAHG